MEKPEPTKPCPLCGTHLPYDKWLKVVGVYEEQQKHRKKLQSELNSAKDQELKLRAAYGKVRLKEKEMKARYKAKMREEKSKIKEAYANLRLKEQKLKSVLEGGSKIRLSKAQEQFHRKSKRAQERIKREGIKIGSEKEKAKADKLKATLEALKGQQKAVEANLKQRFQTAQEKLRTKLERQKRVELVHIQRDSIKIGVEKQRARTEQVSKMAEKYRKARDIAIERAKKMEEMIKKGTTPQLEGHDFERQVVQQLKSRFGDDEIRPTGKTGDIIQTVKSQRKDVGKIIYECKKTNDFKPEYIDQIRRDKAKIMATYGVIVTWATKQEKQGFWVEGDIIVVHPFGVLDIASFLRETLVQMYSLRLSKSDIETKGRALLGFMQSDEFRSRIQETIARSSDAYDLLKKEMKTHVSTWKKRFKIYESIYKNSGVIQNTVQYVLLHGHAPEKLLDVRELPALPISAEAARPSEKKSDDRNLAQTRLDKRTNE